MGKKTYSEDEKNTYWKAREEAGLTRENASESMDFVSTDRIERIEYNKSVPHPEEIVAMSECYKKPALCNYFCSHDCPIGKDRVPEISEKSLAEIAVAMLNTMLSLNRDRDRFLQIVADGKLSDEEIKDFVKIRDELEEMSHIVDSLRLWTDNTIASGEISRDKLQQ